MSSAVREIAIHQLMNTSGVRFGTSGARGLAVDMTNEVCFAYTLAFLKAISATSGRVALAMDLRPSSPRIASACAAAIRYAGLQVDFYGAIPTPALAYHAQQEKIPCIMVTGSHIPFDRNGIKFYSSAGEITKADEVRISQAIVHLPSDGLTVDLPAINPSAYRAYVQRYLQFFPAQCLAGITLGFYEHSSVAREVLRDILERLGAKVISLGRTDEFVPIDTEAVSDADVQQARRWAEQYRFDAILSTDGDGDRPLLGDERGGWLRGDIAGILCAQYLGAEFVATTVSCNTAVELCGSFNNVRRTRIGSPHVIEAIESMLAAGAGNVVGFEPNGGFLVGAMIERNGRQLSQLLTRDAALPILCLLSMAIERKCQVSELSRSLPSRFTASDRLQSFPTETSHTLLSRLAASKDAIEELLGDLCGKLSATDQTDGLRLIFENGEVVHFRPSGNAPELRCYAESSSQERAEQLVRASLQRIRG